MQRTEKRTGVLGALGSQPWFRLPLPEARAADLTLAGGCLTGALDCRRSFSLLQGGRDLFKQRDNKIKN